MSASFPEYMNYTCYGHLKPSRVIQIRGYEFGHEVRVWLPPSYRDTDREYRTLWVTDNALEVAVSALWGVVVGCRPRTDPCVDWRSDRHPADGVRAATRVRLPA